MSNIQRLSPEPPSSKIDEAEVSTNKLASILSSAVIDNTIDEDGHIYATEGLEFPVWIIIDTDRKLLVFSTYHTPDDETVEIPPERLLSAVNEINQSHIAVQFFWAHGKLWGNFWMTYDTALDPRHFIKMLRRFSGAFYSGARDLTQSLAKRQSES